MLTRSARPLLLALVLALLLGAADPMQRLDDALKAAAAFTYGQDSSPLKTIEQIALAASTNPAQRAAVEQRIAAALAAGGTRDAREFFCRQLYAIGTAQSVPTLESLLAEPDLSHMARFALGRIDDPAALAALHRALPKTNGKIEAGIIGTLGNRRYAPAIPDLAARLTSTDSQISSAAALALGQIGNAAAATALQNARAAATAPAAAAIDDALLACADQFLAANDSAAALRIYQACYAPTQPKHLRIAALRGLAAAGGPEALNLLANIIRGADADLRAIAIGFTRAAKDPAATTLLANLLPTQDPAAQELILVALAGRSDPAALPAITAAASSPNQPVRIAAYDALGNIGAAPAAPILVRAAAKSTGEEQRAARASLLRLGGNDVNTALVDLLKGDDPSLQAEASRALGARHARSAVNDLLKLTRTASADARRAAIAALGETIEADRIVDLLNLVVNPHDPADRPILDQAIKAAFRRIPDPEKRAAPVLAALQDAPAAAKAPLLRLLVNAPTPAALAAVSSALNSPDPALKDAAIRTLADWPTAAPAEQLLTLARQADNPTYRALAVRSYIRMAGLSPDPTPMYLRAMDLAQNANDKRLVLAGLGTASTPAALDLVERHLADPQVQAEAALAATQVADRLRQTDEPRARSAMRKVVAAVPPSVARDKAQELLNELDQFEDHILRWEVSEFFKAADGQVAFDTPHPPEQGRPDAVRWQPITKGIGQWDINLESTFGNQDHCAAYVRTRIWSPRAQQARLEMGSDDALKAWLNGKPVFAHYQNRGAAPRQDLVPITLNEGWNDLMLKVVDHEGGWVFACRIRKPDGTALEGLKTEAR